MAGTAGARERVVAGERLTTRTTANMKAVDRRHNFDLGGFPMTVMTARGGKEGTTTKAIESYTAEMPSGLFLSLAVGSMALSAMMMLAGRKNVANFIGQWVPTILIMGLYNKLVKVEGSE
jgi:hypothetical protein